MSYPVGWVMQCGIDMHHLTIPCACVLASENRVFSEVMAENLRGEMFSPAHTLESWLEKPHQTKEKIL